MAVRTVLERGPKGKRSVAFSIDWPGLLGVLRRSCGSGLAGDLSDSEA
jgi:hypothetical protein